MKQTPFMKQQIRNNYKKPIQTKITLKQQIRNNYKKPIQTKITLTKGSEIIAEKTKFVTQKEYNLLRNRVCEINETLLNQMLRFNIEVISSNILVIPSKEDLEKEKSA